MTDIEKEREAFEAAFGSDSVYGYIGFTRSQDSDGYWSELTDTLWDGWLARAKSERVVSVGKLEALPRYERGLDGDMYDAIEYSPDDALWVNWIDIRALIAKAGVSNG